MISSLELANWRSHSNTKVEFGKGTNLIIGIMGSGKSAILDGISFALYGTFPALKRRSLTSADLIRHGEKELSVALDFEHNGKKYRIERRLRKGKSAVEAAAKFYEGGELKEKGQSRATSMVEETLGMGFDLFNRAIYSEQNNIGYFLQLDPGRRKKEMDLLLGLDKFESARESAVRIINRVESERKALEKDYDASEYRKLEAELGAKKESAALLEKRAKGLSESLASTEKKLAEAEKVHAELKASAEKKRRLLLGAERTKALIGSLEADLSKGRYSEEWLAKMEKEFSALKEKLSSMQDSLNAAEKGLALLERKAGAAESGIKSAEKATAEKKKAKAELASLLGEAGEAALKEGIASLERKVLSFTESISGKKAEIKSLEESAEGLSKVDGKCPLCGTGLSRETASHLKEEREKLIAEKKKENEKLEGELLQIKRQFAEEGRKLKAAEALQARISALKEGDADALRKEFASLQEEASKKKEARKGLSTEKDALDRQARELQFSVRAMKDLREKVALLSKEREKLAAAEKELAGIKFDEREFDELSTGLRKLSSEKERITGELSSAKKELKAAGEYMKLLISRMESLEKMKKRAEETAKLSGELMVYRNALVETQAALRTELVEAITSAMNSIWPILYPYADYKSLRVVADEKDYVFQLHNGEEWLGIESVASGGEKACLSLTLRIAMATVLAPEVGWLMLDEPTHNLDSSAVRALSEAFETKVPQLIDQALVITHEENLMNSEFANSYRFEREKETGGPTKCEQL